MASDLNGGDALLTLYGVPDDMARDAALFITGTAHGRHGDHAADAAWARDMLEAVGLIPTAPAVPPAPAPARPRSARYGRCPVCKRSKAVRIDGTVTAHKRTSAGARCDGEGKRPVEEDA